MQTKKKIKKVKVIRARKPNDKKMHYRNLLDLKELLNDKNEYQIG